MILVVAKHAFGEGAGFRRARQEIAALLKAGNDVSVVCQPGILDPEPAVRKILGGDFPGRLTVHYVKGVTERRYLPNRPEILMVESVFAAAILAPVRRLATKADLIVCHNTAEASAVLAATRFLRRRRPPLAIITHSTMQDLHQTQANPYRWPASTIYERSEAYVLPRADLTVGVSEHTLQSSILAGSRPEAATALLNPVDTQDFQPAGEDQVKDIDILFMGRLSREKGVDLLLEAVASLESTPTVFIAGEGPLRVQLEATARASGADVTFLGWLGHKDIPPLVRRARLLAVPSRSEAQGVVILEAMAAGVPVVASRIGGVPEMVQDGESGWLFTVGDVGELRGVLQRALTDDELRIRVGKAASEAVLQFDLSHFLDRVVDLYASRFPGIRGSAPVSEPVTS